MSTGSEDFSLLICLDAIKFVLLSFFTVVETGDSGGGGGGLEGKIGNLSKGVFERCTSTGSEDFSRLICFENLGRTTAQEFKKIHFRLTCAAQKRLCLFKFPIKGAAVLRLSISFC